ncbi:MAG TPA: TonB-dependent receptor, partial [Gemmatimonadales bacterium]
TIAATIVFSATLSAQSRDTVHLAPIVVTATRVPTPADAVPAAVTVLSGDALRARGIRTVAQALRLVPGAAVVTTSGFGSQTSLFLRGGESDYVKVLVDGVPQNAPGGAYDFSHLTTDNVDRIEVVRGPASVLYGSDAVTGVIQIFTRQGHGVLQGDLGVQGGTYGTAALDLAASGGGRSAGFALGLSRLTSDGIYAFGNAYRNSALSLRLHARPDRRSDASLALRYDDDIYHFPTDFTGVPVYHNQHQSTRGPSVALDVGRWLSPAVDVRLTADLRRDEYQYALAPNGPADTTTFAYSSTDWTTRRGAGIRADLHLPNADVATLGTEYEHEAMTGTTTGQPRLRDNGAFFGQLAGGVARRVSYTVGARLEDNQRFGNYLTYRGGASIRVLPGTRVRASVGTGFKEPSFFQNYATGFVVGNPALRPEHSFSWEIGVDRAVGAASLRATYFDERFRDLIDYTPSESLSYHNVPAANANGLELSAAAPLAHGLGLTASYTYTQTRVISGGADSSPTALFRPGQALIRRPAHQARASLDYAGPRGAASLGAAYVGRRADEDYGAGTRVTLAPYVLVDLAAEVPLLRGRGGRPGFTLTVRAENLLNARYQQIRNYPAPARTILFGGRFGIGS